MVIKVYSVRTRPSNFATLTCSIWVEDLGGEKVLPKDNLFGFSNIKDHFVAFSL